MAIGPGRRQSWRCREAEQNENAEATPKDVGMVARKSQPSSESYLSSE